MNIGQLHQVLNHFPLVVVFFGLALLVAGMVLGVSILKKASLWVFLLLTALGSATYVTGKALKKMLAGIPAIPVHAIESHESFALWGLLSMTVLGISSLIGLVLYRKTTALPQRFIVSVLVLALLTGGVIARTASLGGKIMHASAVDDKTPPFQP